MAKLGADLRVLLLAATNRLGKVAAVNAVLIFGMLLYFAASAIGDIIVGCIEYILRVLAYLAGKPIPESIKPPETTPWWMYMLVLLLVFLICMLIVFWHENKKLWPHQRESTP